MRDAKSLRAFRNVVPRPKLSAEEKAPVRRLDASPITKPRARAKEKAVQMKRGVGRTAHRHLTPGQARRMTFSHDEINVRRLQRAHQTRPNGQTRIRTSRYRDKLRGRATKNRGEMIEKVRKYTDGTRECRRLTQYSRDSVLRMLTVGTAPSPRGSRSPIARAISHVKTSISRRAVDFWRNRAFCLYREVEDGFSESFGKQS